MKQPKELYSLVESVLDKARQKGATQAEVGVQVSKGQQVSVRQQAVETVEYHQDQSISIIVYHGQQKGSSSVNDLSPNALENALDAAIALSKVTGVDPYAGLAEEADMAVDVPDLDLYHPWDCDTRQAAEWGLEIEKIALNSDKRICNSDGVSVNSAEGCHVYGNSYGWVHGYLSTRHSASCVVLAQSSAGMERDYEYTACRDPQALWSAHRLGAEAARRACARLDPRVIASGEFPVLFDTRVSSGLIGHFVSAISGGNLFRKTSFLCDSLGQPVFPKGLRLWEDPWIPKALGSSPFDADGVATQKRDLVHEGIVRSYVLGAYSARQLGLRNTGNAGGITNLWVSYPELHTQEALLRQMGTGLWVTELMGQGVNLMTGDYSRGAAGFWVENGQVQYPVSGITIAGQLSNMWMGIVGIGNDIDARHSIRVGSILIDKMMIAGK